jgi:tryptophanyl-tRNA synthetase
MAEEMVVTPYEVKGEIDYDRLTKEFGISEITPELRKKLEKYVGDNMFLRRGIFGFHRDLDFILKEYEKDNKFHLYTGRGPSGQTHLGHLIPYIFTKQLQDAFKVKLLFQLTDDEKFMHRPDLSVEDVKKFSYDNALDVIATGFDPKLTEIFIDTEYAKTLYNQAIRIAKHITFSTTKATFGFGNDTNVGKIFFTSMQAVPAMLESVKKGKNVPCLIPHAVDQDPHFRIARDTLPKLGYLKPASIQCKFIPGLGKGGKMSASEPATTIFTTDDDKTIEKKVKGAFTGGRDTIEEQKKLGGNPDICPVYMYYYFLFEENDKKLNERMSACKGGKLMCGECKAQLIPRMQKFFAEHRKKREQAKKSIDKFMVKD